MKEQIEQLAVSIPQSGFGAFELPGIPMEAVSAQAFQSLSRDSGRLNASLWDEEASRVRTFQSLSRDSGRLNLGCCCCLSRRSLGVSIPQSGFGAFEPGTGSPASRIIWAVSIPQSGFGAFEHIRYDIGPLGPLEEFQSLSRDSGRLNYERNRSPAGGHNCFNPSVGIRGV